jgi:hypothetical protein|tara:strand:- start:451 stop:717 length:267 start_codon:yes stop_codon:yes gene_type:complete
MADKKNLGMVFINTNKDKPTSFDIKGSVIVDGKKLRLGGYRKEASGDGKMAKGTEFYAWYRVEPFEEDGGDPARAAEATAFEPSKLEV